MKENLKFKMECGRISATEGRRVHGILQMEVKMLPKVALSRGLNLKVPHFHELLAQPSSCLVILCIYV